MNLQGETRQPAVAGQFYESDPVSLRRHLQRYVDRSEDVDLPADAEIKAVILPHAGYIYSGETAVRTVYPARNSSFKRVLALAPSHRQALRGVAMCDYAAYSTPLGNISVDSDAVSDLKASGNPAIECTNYPHDNEHSLEVELPILQMFFEDFKLLPFICGQFRTDVARRIASTLVQFWDQDTFWAVSSDFTHFGHAFGYVPFHEDIKDNLKILDLGAVDKIVNLDLDGFNDYVAETGATICGARPISVLLAVIELVNAQAERNVKAKLVHYTTSGESSGDYSHCVSYAGIIFYQ